MDIIAPLVALFFAWFRKEKRLGEHIYIIIFLFIQLGLNTWAKAIMHCNCGLTNIYLYKTNCLLSFITLSLYFLHKWRPYISPAHHLYARIITGILSLVILAFIYFDGLEAFNSYSYSLSALFICTWCILYYYAKLKKPDIANITNSRSFWFVSGLFIYYAGCFFIFLSFKFLTLTNDPHVSSLWAFHNIMFVPMCISFSTGFRCSTSPMI